MGLLLCIYVTGHAQLTYSPVSLKQLDPSVCWNVKVQAGSSMDRVVLLGTISDENDHVLVECESEKIMLQQGLNSLSALLVRTAKIKFTNEHVKKYLERYGSLPAGRYKFCTAAKTVRDHDEIGQDCIVLTQISTDTASNSKKIKLPKGVELYGQAGIEHIYSNRQGSNQLIPPHLLRVFAQPNISIYNIPVGLNMYYTTERTALLPNQFSFSLQFDANRFRENLRNAVEQKLMETTKLNAGNLQQQLKNATALEQVTGQLEQYKKPDWTSISNLENQIKSTDYANLAETLNKMQLEADRALQQIDYDNLRLQLTEARNNLAVIIPRDSAEEIQIKLLNDTLNARQQALEARKDSVLSRIKDFKSQQQQLQQRQQQLKELTTRLTELKAAAQQYQELIQKKSELENVSRTLTTMPSAADELFRLSDPTVLRQNLIERGMFTGMNKLLFGVRQLTLGTVYPVYSPLMLNGIQVHGGAIEINPGLLILNVTGGNTHLGIRSITDVFNNAYQRWMVGGRLGIGKIERSHFIVSYIHSFDQKGTVAELSENVLRPLQNDVLGVQTQVTFWKGRIRLQGEAAGSGFNRNRNDESIKNENSWYQKIPAFLKPNLSTSYDFAYMAKGDFNLWKGSLLSTYTEYIGPGYQSFGVPFLRNDLIRYGTRLEQQLLKNRLKIHAKYRYELDNLISSKRATSVMHFYGGGIQFNQSKLPSLRVDYNGNMRNNAFGSQLMNALLINSGYSYKIAKTSLRTMANYQWIMSRADSISMADYTLNNINITQSVSLRFPITVLATIGFNQTKSKLETIRQIQVSGGVMSSPFKNFNAGLNLDYTQNLSRDFRFGLQTDISYNFFKHLTLSVNCRYNKYRNYFITDQPFNEVVLTSRLMVVW